jgi:aldose 1-epimerase
VPVPVSFGWHPYLALPGVQRADWHVELPVRTRALLDERGIPTGRTEPVDIPGAALGERGYDDLFTELGERPVFALEGGGRRVELEFGEGYGLAQVYAPAGEHYICFEPMTAPTDALVSGTGLRFVSPGASFSARFRVRVSAPSG